jgi:hypothetical protein
MAAGRHNLTRRALLGVAFAAPTVLGDCADHPAAAPDAAMARRWDPAPPVGARPGLQLNQATGTQRCVPFPV